MRGTIYVLFILHNVLLVHRNMHKEHERDLVEFEAAKVRSRAGPGGTFVLKFDTKSRMNYAEVEERKR